MKNLNMKNLLGFSSVLFLSAATAFAQTEQESSAQQSVAEQQKSLLEKLDSLNDAVLGLRVNGSVEAGFATSMAKSDQFSDISPKQESQAYTTANLIFTARPSSETEARVELRLHKDWQNAYEENNNPIIGHWFSYDGLILDKHVAFNLGYMRIGYTAYTLYTPQPELLQEPEVFAAARTKAMADRNLDTTNNRLLQGLNVEYNSGNAGAVDNIQAQVTGARLRNIAKKNDESFFDFDWADRYMLGARAGVEAYGARIGANYVYVFDRELSFLAHDLDLADSVYLDKNTVFSGELGFDSKKILPDLPFSFGLTGEFAMSWWEANLYTSQKEISTKYNIQKGNVPNADGALDSIAYVGTTREVQNVTVSEKFADDNGKSFTVAPYVQANVAGLNLKLGGRYLQNDKNFWSEMASAPSFRGNAVILNANALYADQTYSELVSAFGMSSLENLYFQVYNSNPYNATNIQSASTANVLSGSATESGMMYSRLYNNYKNVNTYRNGYTASTTKRLEQSEALLLMDGTMDIALPYGIATPDRKGFEVSFDGDWNAAINLNVRFSQYNQDQMDNKYTHYAAGVGVRLDQVLNAVGVAWPKMTIQGSFAHSEENNYFKRKSDRIMAGLSGNVWGPIGFLAGVETFKLEYGNLLPITSSAAINKTEEMLLRVGPRFKIAPASYLSVQYGLLTDKVSFTRSGVAEDGVTPIAAADEFSIDKNVIMADVTVTF